MIKRNDFHHNFCLYGCAYKAEGDKYNKMLFEGNTYEWQLASDAGAVFDGSDYDLKETTKLYQAQMFVNETIRHSVGGAIVVKNANGASYTIFLDCYFFNNFGRQGASIGLSSGGGFAAFGTMFEMDLDQIVIPYKLYKLADDKTLLEGGQNRSEPPTRVPKTFLEMLDESLTEELSDFIDEDSVIQLNEVSNVDG